MHRRLGFKDMAISRNAFWDRAKLLPRYRDATDDDELVLICCAWEGIQGEGLEWKQSIFKNLPEYRENDQGS